MLYRYVQKEQHCSLKHKVVDKKPQHLQTLVGKLNYCSKPKISAFDFEN